MIFDKRTNYKPFEYPEVVKFAKSMNNSFWVHDEINFTADKQDFKTALSSSEQQAIVRSLLAIAQIEVAVKTFWGDLYKYLPKPEFNGLGSTFAESEFRHSEAYSQLIEVLGYNDEFQTLIEVPIIKERVAYLNKILKKKEYNLFDKLLIKLKLKTDTSKKDYILKLILFSILIENVSLFSQFATILSFTRFKGIMKNISNVIAWTSVDEQLHANAGIFIINQIRKEYPNLYNKEFVMQIQEVVKESINVESRLLDWVFEKNELEFLSKENLLNFMKYRVNDSMNKIGLSALYNVTEDDIKPMRWFEEEVFANSLDDFFAKRPVDYTKHDKSISADELF